MVFHESNSEILCREDVGLFARIFSWLMSNWNLVYVWNSPKTGFWTFLSLQLRIFIPQRIANVKKVQL